MAKCRDGKTTFIDGVYCICRGGEWEPHDVSVDRRSVRGIDTFESTEADDDPAGQDR